jgi:hypothetical protein
MVLLQILTGALVVLLFFIFAQLQADSRQLTAIRFQLEKLGAPISPEPRYEMRRRGLSVAAWVIGGWVVLRLAALAAGL